jgi:hypothetical protein
MLRRFFKILFLALLLPALFSCASRELIATEVTAENFKNPLKLTLTSKGKREVFYRKWDGIDVEFSIQNISNFNAKINLEYIKKAGLQLNLKNKKDSSCAHIWAGFSLEKNIKPFTQLNPGEILVIKNKIYHAYIQESQLTKECQQKYIDLDLEVGVNFPMQVNNQFIYVMLKDKIPVLDIETPSTSN